MARILALDAATQACSVALQLGDQVEERFEIVPKSHAQRLLPMIQGVLAEAEVTLASLDCIAFGRGPGSFTGLRIAAGVVQGLAFGADVPVAPVSTLQTIAQSAVGSKDYQGALVVLNAHMSEIYWANFAIGNDQAVLLGEEQLSKASELTLLNAELTPAATQSHSWLGLGTGWALKESFPSALVDSLAAIDDQRYPHASDMLPFAQIQLAEQAVLPAERALPVYMREKDAWKKSISA